MRDSQLCDNGWMDNGWIMDDNHGLMDNMLFNYIKCTIHTRTTLQFQSVTMRSVI